MMTEPAIDIRKTRSGGVVIFCRDRRAALASEEVPHMVKDTLAPWTVDTRPFWVSVERDDDGEENDLYCFHVPRQRSAPRWWVEAVDHWDSRHGKRKTT